MAYSCYKCNKVPVENEFDRCPDCQISHKELCMKLDARPRIQNTKVREELMAIKEVKQGVPVITYIDRQDAANMGIQFIPGR